MKTFRRHRTVEELRTLCQQQGLGFDDDYYRAGGDRVLVRGGGAAVSFNTVNGRFVGSTPDGTVFNSAHTEHEEETWFQAFLNFFYTDEWPKA